MKCIGTMSPLASLRCPVSIGCSMRMRTSAVSTCSVARIFIGSAMSVSSPDRLCSAAAAADGDLDFLGGGVELAVGLDHRAHVRGLAELEPGRNVGFAAI